MRALIINGANPVASGPNGQAMQTAMEKLDLLVSIDLLQRESHRHADWLIPAAHFLEREELHVYLHALGDRPFLQSSKAVLPLPDSMISDWEFLLRLSEALDAPVYGGAVRSPDDLSNQMLSLATMTVKDVREHPHGLVLGERTTGHLWEDLAEAGLKADLCPTEFVDQLGRVLADKSAHDPDYPFRIISRRRNSTMNSWLGDLSEETDGSDRVEICAKDADRLGFSDGQLVRVSSSVGSVDLKVHVSDDVAPSVAVIEHGWGTRVFDPKEGKTAWQRGQIRNALVDNQRLDPFSGTPRLNGMPVRIDPV